jgi:hypothetical protein
MHTSCLDVHEQTSNEMTELRVAEITAPVNFAKAQKRGFANNFQQRINFSFYPNIHSLVRGSAG